MCEFKIIKKNDDSQILEDIVIISYTEDNELLFKDIMGMGEILKSALIVDVNTLNQTCVVLEHPLVRDFIGIVKNIKDETISKSDIEKFQAQLDNVKNKL
ncbi:MAG: CooT family nickel-binding protein [Candidatus Lokiarchaeota archaeon]|nr:CooT family nickel-binding protein [Candidatus Lokiarchaeota archaeon]